MSRFQMLTVSDDDAGDKDSDEEEVRFFCGLFSVPLYLSVTTQENFAYFDNLLYFSKPQQTGFCPSKSAPKSRYKYSL